MIVDREYRIIIIGGGNIGFRHFEGIIKLNLPMKIYIVDPSEEAFGKFKNIFLPGSEASISVVFKSNLRFERSIFDLAIISTTSDQRLNVTRNLIDNHRVKNIVLEKLITSSSSDLKQLEQTLSTYENVWINYPRRSLPLYQNTKKYLRFRDNLDIEISGTDWNFVSNMPHFIDLIEYITDSKLEKIDFSELDLQWKSSRPSFSDTTGKASCLFSNDAALNFSSFENHPDDFKNIQISIRAHKLNGLIDEHSGKATGNLLSQDVNGKVEFQSDLTGPLALQILRDGTSSLTSFREAKESYFIYISSLETHLDRKNLLKEIKVT